LVWPSLLVMDRSACGVSVSVSVELLLPGLGSVTPLGGLTVAVLLSVPVSAGSIARVRSKLTLSPGARVPVGKLTGLVAASKRARFVAKTTVVPGGSRSLMLAPVTVLGPWLVTVIVYVMLVPGTTLSWLSLLVMDRSASGVSVSVSVALLLAGLGSVT